LLSKDEARRIAVNIAKLPVLWIGIEVSRQEELRDLTRG
jgi:hypothetical protein